MCRSLCHLLQSATGFWLNFEHLWYARLPPARRLDEFYSWYQYDEKLQGKSVSAAAYVDDVNKECVISLLLQWLQAVELARLIATKSGTL